MNRSYKVIWNQSLNCFMAVAEYAKSRGKSSSHAVSSTSTASAAVSSGARLLRLSALSVGLITAGLSMSSQVFAAPYAVGGGTAVGTDSIAIGNLATTANTTTNAQSIAIGAETKATGDQSVALGANVVASGNSSVAVGGDDVDKIANNTIQAGQYTTITGGTLTATNYTPTTASGAGASAFGVKAVASGNFSSAIGMTSSATGSASVALGVSSNAAGQGALAIGAVSTASNTGSVAIGINSKSSGTNSIAIGSGNSSTTGANAVGTNAVAIGANATASADNSVALGAGSTTTAPSGNSFLTNVGAVPANGVVSVGSSTVTRRIQNVAGGSADTDAVNVAQLKAQNSLSNQQGTSTAAALGGSSTYTAATGTVSAPSYSLNNGTVTANTVGGALTNLDGRTTTNTTNIAGNTSSITNLQNQTFRLRANTDTATAVGSNDTVTFLNGNNVNITRNGNNVTIGTSATPTFTSVTSTGAMTAGSLNTGGALTVTGTSNLNGGANLNNNKITGLANGTAATDAATFGQLTTANTKTDVLGTSTAANLGGDATYNTTTGAVSAPAYSLNNGTVTANTVGGALTNLDGRTTTNTTNIANVQAQANRGLNISAAGGTADNVQLGETVDFTNTDDNLVVSSNGANGINYNLAENIDLGVNGSVLTGNTRVNNAGITVTGGTNDTVLLSRNGLNNGNNVITNVANGVAATDAATFGQLSTTNTNVATNTTNIANVQAQANQGFNITSNGSTNRDNVQLGQTVNFTNADGNLEVTHSDNAVNYNLADNINVDSVTAGSNRLDQQGLFVNSGNERVAIDGMSGVMVHNASNGNGSHVTSSGVYVHSQTGFANYNANSLDMGNYTNGDASTLTTSQLSFRDSNNTGSRLDKNGLSFTNNTGVIGPNITASGISAGNTKVTNVASGTAATDAVNKGQLDAFGNATAASLSPTASYNPVTGNIDNLVYTLDDGTNSNTTANYNNVSDALGNLNTRTTTNTSNIDDLTQGRIGLVRQDSGTGAISVGQNTNGTLVDFTGTEGTRTLTGLSNGSIAENSTDAVTGDQLNTTNNNVSSLQGKTFSLQANGDTATAVGQNDTVQFLDGDNINITRSGNNITVATARDVNFDSVSAGDNTLNTNGLSLKNINGKTEINGSTIYIEDDQNHTATYTAQQLELTDYDTGTGAQLTDTGLSFVDNFQFTGPSIGLSGIDAGDITIKNVAGGVNATDAVNKGQLDAFGNATAASLSPTASYNPVTGNIDNLVYTLDDGTNTGITANYGNVSGALGNLDARTTANTSNIDDLTQGRIGLVRQDSGTGAILLGQNTNGTLVDFTGTDGTRTLTGLSNGNIAENSTDAVTGDQLNTTNTNVTAAQNTADAAQATADLGFNITSNGSASSDNVALGETVDFTNTDGNLVANHTDNGINYDLANDISVNSINAGNSRLDNNGLRISNAFNDSEANYTADGISLTQSGSQADYNSSGFFVTDEQSNTGSLLQGGNFATFRLDENTGIPASGSVVTPDFMYVGNIQGDGSVITNDGFGFSDGFGGMAPNLSSTSPSIRRTGIDAGNTIITSVADGMNTTDAVNKGQLDATNTTINNKVDSLGKSVANSLGGDAIYTAETGLSNPAYTLDDGSNTGTNVTANNVGDALNNLDGRTTTNTSNIANVQAQADLGFNIGADNGTDDNVQLGETINFTNTDGNLVATVSENGINYDLADDISVDSVTANDGNGNVSTLTATGTNVTDGISTSNYGANGFVATDGNGNSGRYNAGSTVLTDNSGNTNASAAIGNAILDDSGNVNLSGAIGNAIFDSAGNANLSGAQGSVVFDNAGNRTITSATGTNVTDGINTSNYGANGLTATDAAGNSTLVNQTGVSFTNNLGAATGPSITAAGINAGNSTISNVADGVAITDVATIGQLQAANGAADAKTDALGNSTATNLGGGAIYTAATGTVSAPTYTLNDGTNTGTTADFDNVGGALSNLDGRTTTNTSNIANVQAQANRGFNISADNGVADNVQLGETVDFTNTDGNLVATVSNNGINYDLAENIDLGTTGSIRAGNTVTNNAGITILNGPVDTVTLGRNGLNNGGNRVTNVANGIAADDAATFGQVTDVNNKVNTLGASTAANLGGGATYTAATGTVSAPTYTLDNGANTGTTADFDNVGSALENLNTRTKTNTTDIADLASGKTGLVRQDNGTSVITVGAATGGTAVDFTNSTGVNRQLTGVASAGDYTVAGNATNAVNAGDLNTAVGNIENSVTDKGLTFAGDRGVSVKRKLGETLTITGGEQDTAALANGNNIGVSTNATNDGLLVQLAKNIDLGVDGSVKTGNTVTNNTGIAITDGANITAVTAAGTNVTDGTNTSNYSANGLSINNGPSITATGIDSAGNKITNIADATNAGDAVNFGQLQASNNAADVKTDALGNSTATNLGGGAMYTAATGTVSAPTYTLDDGSNTGTNVTANNVGDALNNLDGRTTTNTSNIANVQAQANQGFNISAAGGTANNVQLGETIDFTNTDGNLVATASANGINYNLAENIDLGANGSLKTGNTVTNNAGVRVNDGTNITALTAAGTNVTDGVNSSNYGANGFTIVGGPSVTTAGINAGNKVITNLADGVAATDAATKGQVDAVSTGLTDLAAGAVQYQRNLDDTVNYDNVTFAGTQAVIDQDENGNDVVVSGGTRLSNVANGINAADAVNKGQLDSLIAQNVTKVEVNDQNGNPVTVNITDQVVNRNIDNSNMDSLFLTYNVEGQGITDRLTIGETVQKMNTEGVKFAHTKAVSAKGDLGVTNDSSAGGDNSTAIGVNAIIQEGADSTVALGHNTEASANATNSVVIGKDSQVTGQSSIAIGNGAQALGNQSISIGTGNIVNGNNSGAFGDPSIINGDNSYSVGNNNTINSNDTFVLGNNVTSTVGGSVVLGTGSASRTGAGVAGYLAAGNAAITATTSTTGAVAVGDATNGIYRQVTGVAAGTADSDAVNVSQLKAVSDTLQSNNEALSNAAVQYDKNADGTVNKGSITLGGGAAGTTITNVAAGNVSAGSTDAVNGSQLHNLGNGVAGIIGGDAALDASGNLTASNIGGTGKGNISDAIAAVNQGNAQANENIQANKDRLDAGLSFGADSGATISKPIGDTTALKFEGGNNITTTATSSGIKFDLNGNIDVDNITADTVTTGNTTVSNTGVTIKDGPSMTTAGINAGDKTITGVADGIEVNDAVNLGQLTALDNKLSNSVNELGYKINEVEDDANAGISAAMAMSSLPQAYIPGKSMVGGGIATYNGQSAVAIGVSKVSDNGRWVIKVNGTADTQGNAGGAVGAGFHF